MEPFYIKEALSLLDRVHLFAIQNKGEGSLQHATEGFFITCLCCTGVQDLKVFLF